MSTAPLLMLLLLLTPSSQKCVALQSAYENLIAGSFTVERRLTVIMNGKVKLRELARLTSSGRKLTIERLEVERLDKKLVLEESQTDPGLELGFPCERVEELEDGRYVVRSENGAEELELVLDVGRNALIPAVWRSKEKTRFLWKKMIFETEVIYGGFEWRD